MATVVPRLKKRRISPHASGDATSPSTSQRGMIDASYMPISSPMHDVPMYYSAPSSDIHASSYPVASSSDVMLNQPLPSGPDAPSHPRPRMCIHEIINGQEQPVYVVSDDDDDDDDDEEEDEDFEAESDDDDGGSPSEGSSDDEDDDAVPDEDDPPKSKKPRT